MNSLNLIPEKTALVIIDLQRGIVDREGFKPYTSEKVVENTVQLVKRFRDKGMLIAKVRVDFVDEKDVLKPITDQTPQSATRPQGWSELIEELVGGTGELIITKRQWGAFFGTDLDLQLRRRGIETIVLCGIATNIGVEMTAREAYQHGYHQVFIEDAMTAFTVEEHNHTLRYIFPRIGKVRKTEEVINSL